MILTEDFEFFFFFGSSLYDAKHVYCHFIEPKLDEKALTFDIPDSESDDPDTDIDEVSSIGTTDDDVGDMDDDDEMFTMNSDIPALSQGRRLSI